jgi:hypothetical protein
MKKCFLSLLAMFAIMAASAQLSVGVAANYTMYKQEFQKSTSGAQIRAGYNVSEKLTGVLSFTYGMPIKFESSVSLEDNMGNQSSVDSEIKYNFKTINLFGQYSLLGSEETAGKFYGLAGVGFVFVNYKEEVLEDYDKSVYTATDLLKGNESGFTINLGVGGEYNFGTVAAFGEAAIALPANQANGMYIDNAIPTHFIFNFGVRLPIGGGDY